MDGESQIDTSARGASPRPREIDLAVGTIPELPDDHIFDAEGDLVCRVEPEFKDDLIRRLNEGPICEPDREARKRACDSYAAHIALLQRALEMADGLETACLKSSTKAVLGTLADDLRAALAGADR